MFNLKSIFSEKNQFASVAGYEDLLKLVKRAENAKESFNLAFQGPPASGKTLILDEIRNKYGDRCMYTEGSMTTASGLKDRLDELWQSGKKIECIIIDEADKMKKSDQDGLLGLFEGGKMLSQRVKKAYNFEIPMLKVYISLNNEEQLTNPFKSRFFMLHLPEYSFEQFQKVVKAMLKRLPERLTDKLAKKVWHDMGLKDVRRVKQLGLLLEPKDSEVDIDEVLATTLKYSKKVEK